MKEQADIGVNGGDNWLGMFVRDAGIFRAETELNVLRGGAVLQEYPPQAEEPHRQRAPQV
jgi:hypothetical protein